MKPNPFKSSAFVSRSLLVTALTTLIHSTPAAPLGTAFTYQGRLVDNGSPANGNYDLRFALYDALSAGGVMGVPITNAPVAVSNGLFTVTLDFGGGMFSGNVRWLEVGVRTSGSVLAFTPLTPRQELTPAPNALYAPNAGTAAVAQSVAAGSINNTAIAGGAVNSSSIADGSIAAIDLSAPLLANLALLDRTPQTFTGANIFNRGFGGLGRLIVTGSSSPDLASFTGLGFQYYDSFGEGAIMSSYNDGFGYLSFYTKAKPGQPIAKQMIIGQYGDVAIDQQNANNGVFNNGNTNGVGLSFGTASGEGIASKRTAGGNQYGLDFYTGFTTKMSIGWNGFVGIGTSTPASPVDILGGRWDLSGSEGDLRIGNPSYRLKIGVATDGAGTGDAYLRAQGGTSRIMLGSDTNNVLTIVGTNVGIGTIYPTAKLEVAGTAGTDGIKFPDGSLQLTAPKPVFSYGYGQDPWNTNRFVAPSVIVTVTSSSQQVLVTANKALGSVPGAQLLNLYIGYRVSGYVAAPFTVGGGIFGNKVTANTRVIMGMSGVITGLAPGNYEVGLVGVSTDYANWNSNEWGYTTAVVY